MKVTRNDWLGLEEILQKLDIDYEDLIFILSSIGNITGYHSEIDKIVEELDKIDSSDGRY